MHWESVCVRACVYVRACENSVLPISARVLFIDDYGSQNCFRAYEAIVIFPALCVLSCTMLYVSLIGLSGLA